MRFYVKIIFVNYITCVKKVFVQNHIMCEVRVSEIYFIIYILIDKLSTELSKFIWKMLTYLFFEKMTKS